MRHHYVLGAGMVGCLYDFGPEAYDRKRDALAAAEWYLDGGGEDITDEDIRRMRSDLHNQGIHYFPPKVREQGFGDYIEITRCPGRAPEGGES